MNRAESAQVAEWIFRKAQPLELALLEITRQLHAKGVLDVAEMRQELRRGVPPGSQDKVHLAVLKLCRALEQLAPPVSLVPPAEI